MSEEQQYHEIYVEAKKIADSGITNFIRKTTDIEDPEERDFFIAVANFFLQKRQAEVIKKGLF